MYTTSQIQVTVQQAANMEFSSESKKDKQQTSSVFAKYLSHIKYLEGMDIFPFSVKDRLDALNDTFFCH